MQKPLHILSLGAGVQSTTMALMAAHGEIGPMPDAAIFADTGAEPLSVYEHLRWLKSANLNLPFPIIEVGHGNLNDDTMASAAAWQALSPDARLDRSLWRLATRVANPPFYTRGPKITPQSVTLSAMPLFGIEEEEVPFEVERETDRETFGFLGRSCTRDYKINPIIGEVRRLIGLQPGVKGPDYVAVEQWIGITTDETARVANSRVSFIRHRYPMIEKQMNRIDCYGWLRRNGYPRPPKSRCRFCPFQTDALWLDMKLNEPDDFEAACQFDEAIRNGIRGTLHKLYVHRHRIPLRDVDFSRAEVGSLIKPMIDECEGMCGV